jgi:hypothetical protein
MHRRCRMLEDGSEREGRDHKKPREAPSITYSGQWFFNTSDIVLTRSLPINSV